VLDQFYRSFLQCDVRQHIVDRLLADMFTGHRTWRSFASSSRDFTIDVTEARFSLWKAFGILPDEQELLEDELRAIRLDTTNFLQPLFTDSQQPVQYYLTI